LLEQAEGTAGAAMTPEVRTAALGEPLERVRERVAAEPPPREGLLTVVPVDAERRPHGVISVASLLSGSGEPVPVPAVRADTPIETVLELFAAYDVLAVPVVDGDGRLIGAVAVDDVLDVLLADRLPGARRFRLLAARRRAPR
ncbi:MAG: CBS domain-containing protein, partial [Nocardioidaceae bacterium]